MKRLSGSKVNGGDSASLICIEGFSDLSLNDQANTINSALLEPLEEYRLPVRPLRRLEKDSPEILHITERRVQGVLADIYPRKAYEPDRIPNWLLKEYSDIMAYPVTEILNASYLEQRLPTTWKMADVTPQPKKKPVLDLRKRPETYLAHTLCCEGG